jgi:signal transduction histidine kinase/ligand-binding sensor domain-containing protein
MPRKKEEEQKIKAEVKKRFLTISPFFSCFFFLFSFLLLLFIRTASAQYRFDSWTTDNGLPQNGVRGIAQTPDGYLWFTTFDGLVRFDGVKFTVFDKNNSKGIFSNRFNLLSTEKDGSLIAGTEADGVTIYRAGVFQSFTTAEGLPTNLIQDFSKNNFGDSGEVTLSTDAGKFYFRNEEFVPVPEAENPNQGRFYSAPSGDLWLYDEKGFRQISPTGKETFYPLKTEFYNNYFSGLRLFEDSRRNLWFGDLTGVYCLKDGTIKKYTTSDNIPSRMALRPYLEDSDGSIWFASSLPWIEGVGAVRFKDGKFTIWGKQAGLSSNFIANLFKDREGTIWVTTDKGLNRLQKQFVKTYSTADGLIYNEVYPLLQTRSGDIYIGTTQGLSIYHEGKFTNYDLRNKLGDKVSVTALFEDERARIWIGAVGDLHIFKNGRLRELPEFYKTTVWAIKDDRAGNIWIASEKGLFKLRSDKIIAKYTTAEGLPSNDIKVIHEDRQGVLWFGTYGGLVKFENERFTNFTTDNGLASNRVRSIYEDASGTLWIGTYDGGLSRFADGRFFNFTIESGLSSNGVFQILEDEKNNFWISCNKGIYRVSRAELEDFAAGKLTKINSVAYGRDDGMLNTEANGGRQPAGIKAADGQLWFPTQEGVAIVNPKEVPFNPNSPSILIEDVLIDREEIDFHDGISFQANGNNLEIRYTGVSFIKPEQVRFRYRIEGLGEDWTDVGTIRDVYFPSLPAGDYVFHVIGANSDGIWNEDGARLKIRVLAPFWKTTWFISITSLLAVFMIFMIFKLRERELKRRQIVQQEFARKLLESQEQERKRIASEMHDSLGQYLLAIKNWALFGLNSIPEKDAAREYLTEVSDTSSLAIEEVREIAHNLRPYQLERLGLTNTLEYMLKSFNHSSTIIFNYEIENIDGFLSKDDEIIFYRIVQECINNIIKHSGAENVWLAVRLKENVLEFICRDNGRGFDFEAAKNSSKSGLGLNGIAERVKILKGDYRIESEIEKGTRVIVQVGKNI